MVRITLRDEDGGGSERGQRNQDRRRVKGGRLIQHTVMVRVNAYETPPPARRRTHHRAAVHHAGEPSVQASVRRAEVLSRQRISERHRGGRGALRQPMVGRCKLNSSDPHGLKGSWFQIFLNGFTIALQIYQRVPLHDGVTTFAPRTCV